MTTIHKLVKDWKIEETHWCENHQRVEHSEAWVTKGAVSVLSPKPLVFS